MSTKKMGSNRMSIVETLQSVFGALVGSPLHAPLTPAERLAQRAANDAAQR